jgi:DNA-binding IclR family transcriptional regulator
VYALNDLAEEILSLLAKKGKIGIEEIQDRLSLSRDTTEHVVHFLVDFGFAEFNGDRHHVTLTEPCRRFFAENGN